MRDDTNKKGDKKMRINKKVKELLINLAYDRYSENDAIDFIKRCYSEDVNNVTLEAAKKVKAFNK